MRCRACNTNLSDFESTRKVKSTGEYLDLCEACFKPISDQVEVIERLDLLTTDDTDCEDWEEESDNWSIE